MAKQKDFFTKLKEQGKISKPEFDKFIESLADNDIPDDIIAEIEDKFMTRERALADSDIGRKARAEVYDAIDEEFDVLKESDFKSFLDEKQVAALQSGNTLRRLQALKKIIPETIKKIKANGGGDEDLKKLLKEREKALDELGQEKVALSQKLEKDLEARDDQWKKKLEDIELNYHLDKLTNKFTLAESFDRNAVTRVVMSDIKGNNLKLIDTNGQKSVVVYDEHGKPKYNGNSPVTIESLLEQGFKPFLKKSETPPESRSRVPNQTTVPPTQTDPNRRQGARNVVVKPQKS